MTKSKIFKAMKQAEQIKASARDSVEAMAMAERTAIAKDQNWQAESTTWTFDDNSTLTVCGPNVSAKDWDKRMLMNPDTGSVDTEENWRADMQNWEEGDPDEEGYQSREDQFAGLIEVIQNENGDWVEA